ncbi:unnamed protein product [Euphydryas editha]|uniref:RNA-directed DNA polymerase n=1 Tax=Euphydryas editha TaxID=104508 RepID=A0AAU9TMM2_EUPED|nr:unnamed protein product [Euphydryas editha]
MANLLPPPEKLDLEGDNATLALRWERWKRSLTIFLDATETKGAEKKRATLLLLGGSELQEIIYNLPGAYVAASEGVDVFAIAIEKLDGYFLPKKNKIYERHMFRQIKQEEGEKFEKFVVRLRNQAGKCEFTSPEEQLIDQIVEKCASSELRKKILTIGDSVTLNRIIMEANTLEAVGYQLEGYGQIKSTTSNNSQVNMIKNYPAKPSSSKHLENKCSRCGYNAHILPNQECPAKRKKCNSCGKQGHFSVKCRIRPQKRKLDSQKEEDRKHKRNRDERKINSIEEENIHYIFNVNDDATIECTLGGIKLRFLIDSGCKLNIITDKTWEMLKQKRVNISNYTKGSDKILYPYGSKTPLDVKGTFQTTFETNGQSVRAVVYVVNGGSRDLLGKETAIGLGVLRLGTGVHEITQTCKPFPKFKDVLVEIPVDETCKPVSQPYRRIPIPIEKKVEQKIQELLDSDIIEEVHGPSPWISPVVPILKDNDDLRLCIDMRRVNLAILRENHPLPCMDSLLPKIKKAKYFSKLDIKNAFHQVEIHPNSRYLTTFITSKGLYQYKRLMFGITCAPELFQKILERMLTGLNGVVNFIDDILVYGENEKQHDERLQSVMKTLRENDVLLNEAKCVYKIQKINFLGHELTPDGVKPLKKYVTSIEEFRVPKTIEELQSFLGLVNYINKWLPNLATITEPLKTLLRLKIAKRASIEGLWKDKQDQAFHQLKQALSTIKTLGYYDPDDETQVIADASPVGLGAVLIQKDNRGPRIIAYGNRTLTALERKYSQTEKEALALVWAVEHFNIFLFGKKFDLITDHKPLEFLFGPKSKPCARVERWVLRLQNYRYNIKYQPGKVNIADPLSRLCTYSSIPTESFEDFIHHIVEEARPCAVPMHGIDKSSENDPEIKSVKRGIYNNDWEESVKEYKIFEPELCFYNNILLRGTRIVIPKDLRKTVLDAAHEGHPGIVSMKSRLRLKVWWPRIDKDVENIVKQCKGCTLVGLPSHPVPMKRRDLPTAPWVDVAMDLLGPLPNNDYLLVVIDYYSRYKEIKFTKVITSSQIIKLLKEIFSRLGYPSSITADNGRQFISDEFKEYCKQCNIRLFNTVPYWPQQNGEVERQNRDIIKRLKISQLQKKDLKESVGEYLMMYNSTPHSVTGKSPAELFFRRQNKDKIPSLLYNGQEFDDSDVRDRDKTQKEKGKEYADRKRRAEDSTITEGDKVYVKEMEKRNKLTANFNPTPHSVERVEGGDVLIRNEETGKQLRRNVIHLKRTEGEWKVQKVQDRDEDNRDVNESEEKATN